MPRSDHWCREIVSRAPWCLCQNSLRGLSLDVDVGGYGEKSALCWIVLVAMVRLAEGLGKFVPVKAFDELPLVVVLDCLVLVSLV